MKIAHGNTRIMEASYTKFRQNLSKYSKHICKEI